jgi:hypothetical protein
MDYSREAEACRREAMSHVGKAEAPFLLRLALAFDELDRRTDHRRSADTSTK